ncbi:AAA family ATPase [Roseomonas sp. BN140053]|uniref:AAA family ATPase n=1 Tax=Roseomonas sp. BN140053 TaxID=3391898 RepID=UPI0039EBBAE4
MSWLSRLFGRRPPPLPRVRMPPSRLGQPEGSRLLPLGEAFTPTQPKPSRRQQVRRAAELQRILQALQEDRAHVVLYSERGRGKTSLSNLVTEGLRRSGTIVARYTCEAGSTFDTILRGLASDLPSSLLAPGLQSDQAEGCEAALPSGPLRPRDVLTLPSRLALTRLVCMVDEFDRVEDVGTRVQLADTIKQLSDRDVPLLFVIVGVSENLDQILGQHPSIQRNVLGVHLPLFSDGEIAQLIVRGGRESGYVFSPAAVARVTVLARGIPYMAQLLGLRLTQAAAARGDTNVSEEDFDAAVTRLLGDASSSVLGLYASLTNHGRDQEMVAVLRRIASAIQDPWGRLMVTVEPGGSVMIGERRVSAEEWARLEESEVLQSCGRGSGLYTFRERPLMHHVLLLAARDAALPRVSWPAEAAVNAEAAVPSALIANR